MRNVYFRFLSAAQKCHLLRLLIINNGNGNDVNTNNGNDNKKDN